MSAGLPAKGAFASDPFRERQPVWETGVNSGRVFLRGFKSAGMRAETLDLTDTPQFANPSAAMTGLTSSYVISTSATAPVADAPYNWG